MGYSKPFKPNRSNLPNFYFPAKPGKPSTQAKPRESNKITETTAEPESPPTLQPVTAKQMENIAQIIDAHVKRKRKSN